MSNLEGENVAKQGLRFIYKQHTVSSQIVRSVVFAGIVVSLDSGVLMRLKSAAAK